MDERGKPVRLDDRLFELPDDLVILCLPEWFRSMLLSLCDRPFWGKRVWGRELSRQEIDRLHEGVYLLSVEECDMQITVNAPQNQSQQQDCGGSGSGSGGCSPPPWADYPFPGGSPCYPVPPVELPDDVPMPPVPPDDIEESEWEAYRCKLANYWFDLSLEWFEKVAAVPGQLLTIGSILIFLWNAIPAALLLFVGGSLLELATMVLGWYAISQAGLGEIANFARDWWGEHREEIICKIYDATDIAAVADEIRSDFLDNLVTFAEGRPWWFSGLLDALSWAASKMMPGNLFTASWTLVPPVGYNGITDCTICGDEPTEPGNVPQPDNPYYLSAALAENLSFMVNNNTAIGHTDGLGRFWLTPLTALSYHEVDVLVDISEVIAQVNASHTCHGFIIGQIDYAFPQHNNDGVRVGSNTGGALTVTAETLNGPGDGRWWAYYQNDEVDNLEEYVTDTDNFHAWYAYGNGVMTDIRASFRMQTYGGVSPKTIGFTLLYIMKEAES